MAGVEVIISSWIQYEHNNYETLIFRILKDVLPPIFSQYLLNIPVFTCCTASGINFRGCETLRRIKEAEETK
jgi:hypothetical protein